MENNNFKSNEMIREKERMDRRFKDNVYANGLTGVVIPALTGLGSLYMAYNNYNSLKDTWNNYFSRR